MQQEPDLGQTKPAHATLIASVRRHVETKGTRSLVVDDLVRNDLSAITWSGSPTHIVSVGKALERVDSREVEYLAVRAPNGEPVAKGGIDYAANEGAGTLWQLATHRELQGMGLGTRLIEEAENRIRRRGLHWAVMSVEDENLRARALYERLGYRAFGRERASWEQEDDQGNIGLYETELTKLRKRL